METKNRVELIGHVGGTPEILTLESGKKLMKFSIATNEIYQNSQGEWINDTTWHRIVAWDKMADLIGEQVTKGQKMELVGTIKTRSFVAPDGIRRYYTDIRCDEFKLLEKAEQQKSAGQTPTQTSSQSD